MKWIKRLQIHFVNRDFQLIHNQNIRIFEHEQNIRISEQNRFESVLTFPLPHEYLI